MPFNPNTLDEIVYVSDTDFYSSLLWFNVEIPFVLFIDPFISGYIDF